MATKLFEKLLPASLVAYLQQPAMFHVDPYNKYVSWLKRAGNYVNVILHDDGSKKERVLTDVVAFQGLVVVYKNEETGLDETGFCMSMSTIDSSEVEDIPVVWFYKGLDGKYLLGDKVDMVSWDSIEVHNITTVYEVNDYDIVYQATKTYHSTNKYRVENITIVCSGMLDGGDLTENSFGIVWKQPQKRIKMSPA
jgi:hypothetical protein